MVSPHDRILRAQAGRELTYRSLSIANYAVITVCCQEGVAFSSTTMDRSEDYCSTGDGEAPDELTFRGLSLEAWEETFGDELPRLGHPRRFACPDDDQVEIR